MKNKVAQIIRPVSICAVLAILMTSLIARVPVTLAERTPERAASSSTSSLWPVEDSTSPLANLTKRPSDDPSLKAQVTAAYNKLPLSFELNQGQTDSQVKFLSRGQGYRLYLTPTEAVLKLRNERQSRDFSNPQSEIRIPQSAVLRMNLAGANPAPEIKGLDELPGKSNYLKGNDRSLWERMCRTLRR